MARRSARLLKRSPTPAEESILSNASWETAHSELSPPRNERLPSVVEDHEPALETPQKPVAQKPDTAVKAQKASQLPQTEHTPTSLTPASTACQTPKNRTPILPATQEMHPALHHPTTAKMLDEARWLGFQNMGAHTAPPKAASSAVGQGTPSKTPASSKTLPGAAEDAKSPSSAFKFRFRMKSPFSGLSPSSSRVLNNGGEKSTASARDLFKADEFTAPVDMDTKRKTAVPKGKMKRFSDVHMKQFKKMDSIANHPSSFRTVQLVNTPLKKSSSRADLSKPESSGTANNKLKRTQSKMNLLDTVTKGAGPALGRITSNTDTEELQPKVAFTPLKRTQSKTDLGGSSLPRFQSTVRMVPPSRDGRPLSRDNDNPFAKRVKRTENDDAATTRPASRSGRSEASKPNIAKVATPARKITSQTALPRFASRLMTPTKASLARSHTVKAVKSQSMIPSLLKSPSTTNLFSPTNIGQAMKDGVRDGMRKTSNSLQKVKSILRTPNPKFSNDISKIAAGTHMSPPTDDLYKPLPIAPQTVPAKKHVLFSSSTLERDNQEDWAKSPSPMKLRAGSEIPAGAVVYPSLQGGGDVEYPTIHEDSESSAASPSRRLTFGDVEANKPSEFSFQSSKAIDFGPASTGTIRVVRKSNASSMFDGKKRRLNAVEESSDKENSAPAQQDGGRSAKKAKIAPTEPSKTPSKLPRRTPNKRGSALSKSRLAFLSTPKRSKA
ncbi:unnamed protein product [Periconia digitata]|uniref:Uncharacterized protein n=1 Tax=Periconia digitata TaxID=1303443 RepID=A0A9W4XU91_9PLEO|nr:unnamed protein product [Periconia digitata]